MLSDPFDANYAIFQNDDTNLFPLRVGTSGVAVERLGKGEGGFDQCFSSLEKNIVSISSLC